VGVSDAPEQAGVAKMGATVNAATIKT